MKNRNAYMFSSDYALHNNKLVLYRSGFTGEPLKYPVHTTPANRNISTDILHFVLAQHEINNVT